LASPGGALGHDLRRAQPTLRFLCRQGASAPGADPAGPARPHRRVQQANHRLIGGIDRDRRVQKKSRRPAIAGRTQPSPRRRPTAEIDLGGVLRHDDPLPVTAFPGTPTQGRDNFPGAHLRRIKKPVRCNLARPIAADLAQAQRSSGYNPVKQPSTARRTSRIAEFTNPLTWHHRRSPPNPI
jgi:hypothetical protein